ncbi:helix-turn-helix domain-containing protein [Clostridium sp. YIM B02505]|uniref:Helix-turn-helix domain-containing protein n=1 Tax=Clostridium yunnanense TaxID=2800325 RepID=A0ABS1EVE2_9CLOT|nr:AraC family transcriptional regulator [Clostridium yunnanense]MBK1813354.1 helix-turn-helix domain-containing protein [Clostridium yunnanense]
MNESVSTEKIKRGYLNDDFLFFNLKDQKKNDFEVHYHDFDKIIIFISGDVTYIIEGKSYKLRPWDLLLVGKNDLHLPIISQTEPYERIILWLNPLFLEKHNMDNCDLLSCFQIASERKLNLIRLNIKQIELLKKNLQELKEEIQDKAFGSTILKNALFIQFMVKINRFFLDMNADKNIEDIKYDPRIESVLTFINSNLEKDISIEMLSNTFYLNKYYLMHLFKKETGFTLYGYIQKKRTKRAADLLKTGMQAGEVCSLCGFIDYSSFVRAFKKEFQLSPKQYYKASL